MLKPNEYSDDDKLHLLNKLNANNIYEGDCLEFMKMLPDKYIDCIITDPPYGILNGMTNFGSGKGKSRAEPTNFKIDWDTAPDKIIFDECFRVSKNQIFFGFNYLSNLLPLPKGIICWDKLRPQGTDYSEFELIWSSFKHRCIFIRHRWHGMIRDNKEVEKERIYHPTQKPLEVIKQLIKNYTKEGDLVFDPFMGSGTIALACKQLNRKWIGCEINPEYIKIINKRLQQETLNDGGTNFTKSSADDFPYQESLIAVKKNPQLSITNNIVAD